MRVDLDAAGRDHYREHGWVRLGPLLKPDEVERLRAEEERFRLPVGYGAAGNQTLRVNVQLCHRSAPVRAFCTAGPQLSAVQRLLGPDVCLTHQQFVTKLPDGDDDHSDIPWHQDNGYGCLEPMTDVTVWLPLVDTDEENGCLQLVDRSHLGGLLAHDPTRINPVLVGVEADRAPLSLPLRAGEAVAFSGLLVHGSGPNRSRAVRPALFVRYCEPGTRMISEGGRPVLEDPHSWMVAGEA